MCVLLVLWVHKKKTGTKNMAQHVKVLVSKNDNLSLILLVTAYQDTEMASGTLRSRRHIPPGDQPSERRN